MMVSYEHAQGPLGESQVGAILAVAAKVFDALDPGDTRWRLAHMPARTAITARSEAGPCGFKIGYAVTSHRYNSWLGGVEPAYRRMGIAAELMRRQHDWVFANGFEVIETEVLQLNHAMQQLNEAAGFTVAGVRFDNTEARIIYRKHR